MKKKIWKRTMVYLFVAGTAFAGFFSTKEQAYANTYEYIDGDSGDESQGESPSLEVQLEKAMNDDSLSEEQKMRAMSKVESIKVIKDNVSDKAEGGTTGGNVKNSNGSFSVGSASYNVDECSKNTYDITLAVPYYEQQNGYYCGPATTRQTLHYFDKGLDLSQDAIAKSLGTTTAGTDGANIVTYLNSYRLWNYYTVNNPESKEEMEELTYYGLNTCYAPPILRVHLKTEHGWPYATGGGHFMNISGQYATSNGIVYQVTDPNITRVNPSLSSGKYRISSATAYNGTMAHFRQEFYM